MADSQIILEMQAAIDALPLHIRSQLLKQDPTSLVEAPAVDAPVDTVGVKFELAKFCSELRKHNQGVNWETNKQKPEPIKVEDIISDSQRLFDFLIE